MTRETNRPETLDLRVEIARQTRDDAVQLLLEALFYACYDWIVRGRRPVLDEERIARSVKRRLAGLAAVFRSELARRGLTAVELDARLGWSEGRTERVLAEPSELAFVEAELLREELGTRKDRMFVEGTP